MTEHGFIGQKGLNRKLRKMGPKITEVMKPRMIAIGEEAKFEIQKNLQGHVDSGDLMQAVHMRVDSRGLSVRVGYWQKGNKKNWKKAGWRAHFIEFGTHKFPAFPFIRPAFNKIRRDVAKDVDKDVDKALKAVARGN